MLTGEGGGGGIGASSGPGGVTDQLCGPLWFVLFVLKDPGKVRASPSQGPWDAQGGPESSFSKIPI